MTKIDDTILRQLPLPSIDTVSFYKRDQITTDLICCEVSAGGRVWTFHEEMNGWDALISHLQSLPAFNLNWFAAVSQPAFEASETVAYQR